ncbi:SHOCT domain-containing protein [Streptomyces sp. NPDC093111]|uniref:SHOCT domain-containing protein n=1 Tax=Streptomyces sp. NPDC093111 TaxID=3154978 RepID=UPI003439F191
MLGRGLRRTGRPGLIGVAARTAVAAGTATAVSNRVARREAERAAPAPTAEPTPTPTPSPEPGLLTDEAISSLERLGKLHDQGVLSDEEFALGKDRILRR